MMSLSRHKLDAYKKHYRIKLKKVREFDDGSSHSVVLFTASRIVDAGKGDQWMELMCPCDMDWKWVEHNGVRYMQNGPSDGYHCESKKHAREVIREELRVKHGAAWKSMGLVDAIYDLYKRHKAGEFLGEFNIGTLYVQDAEKLLGVTPNSATVHLGEVKDEHGKVVEESRVTSISFPSREILSAVQELKKRKLLDLNGMVFIPYTEMFRFPTAIHSIFAYWIEEPCGWPNGDAGDCFLYGDVYAKITKQMPLRSGEEIFGSQNIPQLSAWGKQRFMECWLPALSSELADEKFPDKATVLSEISVDQWVKWLIMIRADVDAHEELE